MDIWYTIFVLTVIMVYGTLSLALLGRWAYAKATSLRGVQHLQGPAKAKARD